MIEIKDKPIHREEPKMILHAFVSLTMTTVGEEKESMKDYI